MSKLFKFARDNDNLKLVMICRQIKTIDIINGKALITADESVLDEIYMNIEYTKLFKLFFEEQGLSFDMAQKKSQKSTAEKLQEWLGEKLIIK